MCTVDYIVHMYRVMVKYEIKLYTLAISESVGGRRRFCNQIEPWLHTSILRPYNIWDQFTVLGILHASIIFHKNQQYVKIWVWIIPGSDTPSPRSLLSNTRIQKLNERNLNLVNSPELQNPSDPFVPFLLQIRVFFTINDWDSYPW